VRRPVSSHLRRVLLALALCALLGGPTPGAVGSCSGDSELSQLAEIEPYCEEREELTCIRMSLRQELSVAERDDCRRCALDFDNLSDQRKRECLDPDTPWNRDRDFDFVPCSRRFWPADCRPTTRQTQACLNALRSMDTLDTPESSIRECNTSALCTAKPAETPDLYDAGAAEGS